jgi:hypothetical protein
MFSLVPFLGGLQVDLRQHSPLHQLHNAPAVGGPNGATPYTANDRLMEAFGSTDWPEPLMPTDQQINGPKGNLMNLQAPIAYQEITRLATQAAASGNAQDTNNLLQSVRIVSLPSTLCLLSSNAIRRVSPSSST